VLPDPYLDLRPQHPQWGHAAADGADGVLIHYVRRGRGLPVLLLHGWPGFWYDWRRVLPRLGAEADAIAPDFRGFGYSDKPDWPPAQAYTPEAFAKDIVALLDALHLREVVVAAYDIGATVAQVLARTAPERVCALALFAPAYPGIGMRRYEPEVESEFWYQHFHALPWSDALIGYNRDTVYLYLKHFYQHWVGRKESVRPAEFAAIVDMYNRAGALGASLAYYRARAQARLQEAKIDASALRIEQPTFVVWGEADPVMRPAWADRLEEYFARVEVEFLPGVGHFLPFEAPDAALDAIRSALRVAERAAAA
jgi:pimeloyl-ACP methyl ester carboxylesterase